MQVEVDVKCTETNFGGLRNGKSVTSKPDNYHDRPRMTSIAHLFILM